MKNDNPRAGDAPSSEADSPERTSKRRGNLGAGKESTGGVAKKGTPVDTGKADQSPTAPLGRHDAEKGSGYGGNKGGPKTSSDQR